MLGWFIFLTLGFLTVSGFIIDSSMIKIYKTTKTEEVSQFEMPDSQIMFNCLFDRLFQNEEVSKSSNTSSKEITSIDNNDDSKSISIIKNNESLN